MPGAPDPLEKAKEAAGRAAVEYVVDGMLVGLGTGSTVYWTVRELARRGLRVECVATSVATEKLAHECGLRLLDPADVDSLDIAIDGADEVDPRLNLTKGGGGAHTREKIVAAMSERFLVVVDETKLVDKLGAFGTPVEVLPFAPAFVEDKLSELGAQRVRRRDTPTDNGGIVVDAYFGQIDDPDSLDASIRSIPGVVEVGLFPGSWVERVIVGHRDGSVREITRR
ncbi:MAG: ribose-5-phosphate isomerase [Acidimicrobiales bacterium]|nr:MAG: ribose-5-phosphate isomerase [Acidimicrobiales bacterium]